MSWPEPFFVRAMIAAAALAAIAAPLGCIIVWRRMAYVGETLAQASLLGVALGLALQINLTFTVILAAIIAATVLIAFGQQRLLALDSILGLMHHATLALGVLAISMLKGPSVDLMSFLFGDVFAVTNGDLGWIALGGGFVFAVMIKLWRPLLRLSIDADLATAEGVDPVVPKAVFDILLAVTIAVAMKIVGVLLVMAFLIVPAVSARFIARTPESMAVLAALFGVIGSVLGLTLSLVHDTPGGPSIVLAMTLLAVISLIAGRALKR
ncbi:MAG: metal ABC transporter permease [Hyphomicrobiaceae bacterium]